MGLLHKLCSINFTMEQLHQKLEFVEYLCTINFTMEQLHQKLEFVEYLFRCSHNSTLFSRTECVKLKPFG